MSENGEGTFCCSALQEVVAGLPEPAASTFYVTDDGVLMMAVGLVATEEGTGYLDQAVMYCPFCGSNLQDAKTIAAKVSH
jgi:hypothetical protein